MTSGARIVAIAVRSPAPVIENEVNQKYYESINKNNC